MGDHTDKITLQLPYTHRNLYESEDNDLKEIIILLYH